MQEEQLAGALVAVPLRLYGVYRTYLAPGPLYDGHMHKPTAYSGLLIALRGEAAFRYDDGRVCALAPGRALLGGAGRRMVIETGPEGFEYGLVHYLPDEPSPAPEQARLLTAVNELDCPLEPSVLQLLERLQHTAAAPDQLGQLEKKTLFYQLLGQLLQSGRRARSKASYSAMEEAIRYIRRHYAEPLTLAELAARCGMKPKYFSHQFRKHVGRGPIDYLIRCRMNRACELLDTGDFTVADVARSVGYADAYYFSRLFKKHHGTAPSRRRS
ncbi:helix-turn-helix transcriptional regulator [Paenibacillus sp. IB182496]|uniref:Helix-turn-helix transcriptional regulator n=1 Tax=Paenibacillus sabuli TaxID=2772509 RepID=A0A927GU58_9BACL|nr:AraC family transcriptional regulator [Paenibacillus sabuli]MBD2848579.1 helix-turn-helix transcriptional regulator [Paenibacillus sabuli]